MKKTSEKKQIQSGKIHKIPNDFKKMLTNQPKVYEVWENITPLARNEWICWIISVKKPETRKKHIRRAQSDLTKGKRRPCCWGGCPHREK